MPNRKSAARPVSRAKPITHIHLTVDQPTLTKVLKDLLAEKAANTFAPPAAPAKAASRFIPLKSAGDSALAQDKATGLIWSKTLNTSGKSYAECMKLVEALEASEKKGWRMPTVEELFLIADRSKEKPAIDTDAFPDTKSDWYWTSTPVVDCPDLAWFVGFYGGGSLWCNRGNDGFVRAVRPGQ